MIENERGVARADGLETVQPRVTEKDGDREKDEKFFHAWASIWTMGRAPAGGIMP